MPSDDLHLSDVETIQAEHGRVFTVYWLGTKEKKRDFGVCFVGSGQNIVRQGVAESVVLALHMADEIIDEL